MINSQNEVIDFVRNKIKFITDDEEENIPNETNKQIFNWWRCLWLWCLNNIMVNLLRSNFMYDCVRYIQCEYLFDECVVWTIPIL